MTPTNALSATTVPGMKSREIDALDVARAVDPGGQLKWNIKNARWYRRVGDEGRWRGVTHAEMDGLAALALRQLGLPAWGPEIDDTLRLLKSLRWGCLPGDAHIVGGSEV